jgi:class 3 adenylate cyclase/tetratricopeptide (TPR) repeat protein
MTKLARPSLRSGPYREIIAQLRSGTLESAALVGIWQARDAAGWAAAPEIYRSLGEQLLKGGQPLLAYDIVREGLKDHPADVRLRQLQGLALARSGASERAGELLQQLVAENHADTETLGMLARTYKDRAVRAGNRRDARTFWRRAAQTYAQAHQVSGDYWTGINAATTALLIGQKRPAAALAKKIRAQCERELRRKDGDKYWLLATLGEAALIERDWAAADDYYARAAQTAGRRFGDLQASRRNARLLFRYWQIDGANIERSLRIPPVAVFSGHMIDQATRAQPRFPGALEGAVAAALRERIELLGAATGYASAARGSDLLFLEAMLEAGREIVVVLPYQEEEFLADGYDPFPDAARWRERYTRVIRRAGRVVVASNQLLEIGGVSYDYANQLLLGLARIRARQLETEVVSLAVWDRGKGDGPGGTASAVNRWRKLKIPGEIIDLCKLQSPLPSQQKQNARPRASRQKSSPGRAGVGSQIMAMLFADAVSFTKLQEQELPRFVRHFLGRISRLIDHAQKEIVARNTWGDGIYLVFRGVREAGHFALDLGEMAGLTNWERHGLPAGLNLRIGVHAGPVYECANPIKQTYDFFGAHVSRTARIEPITPPGQVYASEAFAALAAARNVTDLAFEYAGQVPMPKGYGVFPMYHVTRR